MAQRLATPASPDSIVLDERVATLSYRSQAAGAVVREQVERDRFSAQLLELMKKLPREQDVSVAILRWAGQPLVPGK
jgi:NifB/MoaA-like Fe-S oxidoreductase